MVSDKQELWNTLGCIAVEDEYLSDNLGIVLASYFDDHPDRPGNDPVDENGWGEWVMQKTWAALDLILEQVTLTAQQNHQE